MTGEPNTRLTARAWEDPNKITPEQLAKLEQWLQGYEKQMLPQLPQRAQELYTAQDRNTQLSLMDRLRDDLRVLEERNASQVVIQARKNKMTQIIELRIDFRDSLNKAWSEKMMDEKVLADARPGAPETIR